MPPEPGATWWVASPWRCGCRLWRVGCFSRSSNVGGPFLRTERNSVALLSFAHDLQSIGFLTDIRESAIVYPVIMTVHLCTIAAFGGMILMSDLRLLGWAMQSQPVSDVVGGLRHWKWLGFCIMVTAGLLLGTSEAEKYSGNPYFWIKMCLLALILIHA